VNIVRFIGIDTTSPKRMMRGEEWIVQLQSPLLGETPEVLVDMGNYRLLMTRRRAPQDAH
jgi:hypothetical protein